MFYLSDNNEHARLKSYSATVNGKAALLKITVQVTDTFELSFLLRALEDLQKATEQRARPPKARADRPAAAPKSTKTIGRQVMLALPPPCSQDDA